MKWDFHVHYKRHARDAEGYEADMVRAATAKGLDGICFTEHLSRLPEERLRQLRAEFPQIKIWSGVEVNVAEGSHALLFGSCPTPEPGIPWDRLKALAKEHHCLTCLAHPFRKDRWIPDVFLYVPPDYVEIVSKNTPAWAAPLIASLVWGGNSSVKMLINSDAHKPRQVGWHFNYRSSDADSLAEFLEECLG